MILIRARGSTTGDLPFRFSVRFVIAFVNGQAVMILIVDHPGRLPEGIVDCLQFRRVKQIYSSLRYVVVS
jgi:hypothetical protein